MPFYRILGDWDEMGPVGDAEVDGGETGKANQQVRRTITSRHGAPALPPSSSLDDSLPACRAWMHANNTLPR